MKYAVDRIEEDIVVLEEVNTKEVIEINKSDLDFDVVEGNILSYNDNTFLLDTDSEVLRRKDLQNKLNRLKGLKKDE